MHESVYACVRVFVLDMDMDALVRLCLQGESDNWMKFLQSIQRFIQSQDSQREELLAN